MGLTPGSQPKGTLEDLHRFMLKDDYGSRGNAIPVQSSAALTIFGAFPMSWKKIASPCLCIAGTTRLSFIFVGA